MKVEGGGQGKGKNVNTLQRKELKEAKKHLPSTTMPNHSLRSLYNTVTNLR
jgi:hypothetical protein